MNSGNVFNLSYLKEQLKKVSELRGDYNTGKYYVNFNLTIEQKALLELLLSERITEMEINKAGV